MCTRRGECASLASDRVRWVGLVEPAIGFLGCACLLYGISRWSSPASYVVAGVLLIVIAWWPSRGK